ncbi:MAG: transposase [Thermodesulfovibrionales bacterium]|nr:transposase [Thermodesulfovibrionales bacterium]
MATAGKADATGKNNMSTIYHVFTKSIEGYRIFRTAADYERMRELLNFYRIENPPAKYSLFHASKNKDRFFTKYSISRNPLVKIIAYCLMPTHLHLILSEEKKKGISFYIARILNSYTRYFNTRYGRKGPLFRADSKRFWLTLMNNYII